MSENNTLNTLEYTLLAITLIKEQGFKKGSGGVGSISCPKCGQDLSFSVASYNGHIRGRCSTTNCLSWMQ